jgi:hypothetical protein
LFNARRTSDRLPTPVVVALVNLLLLGCMGVFVSYFWPLRCPDCHRLSMVRLIPLLASEEQSKSTHCCSCCGRDFWKRNGVWQVERRQTWWDSARRRFQDGEYRAHQETGAEASG